MILCCGEALIDFLPFRRENGSVAFQPFNGGSIYNVAIGLGRLGRSTGFFGGLSTDFFGKQLVAGLRESHVDTSTVVFSERASTLAFVQIVDDEPAYVFVDEGSAARSLQLSDIPVLAEEITALHFGSISLVSEPAGTIYETCARRHHTTRLISFDPNIRPGQISDRDAYMCRFREMIALADIVKLSDQDISWLAPGQAREAVVTRWLETGVKLVVVTRGAEGAIAFREAGVLECEPVHVTLCDTIGAGDSFMAGLLAALDRLGALTHETLEQIDGEELGRALNFASRAASITVGRAGADPPWSREVQGQQEIQHAIET